MNEPLMTSRRSLKVTLATTQIFTPGFLRTLTREVFCTRNTRATKSSFAVPDTNSTSMRPYCCRPGSGQYCRQGWDTERKLCRPEPVPTQCQLWGFHHGSVLGTPISPPFTHQNTKTTAQSNGTFRVVTANFTESVSISMVMWMETSALTC